MIKYIFILISFISITFGMVSCGYCSQREPKDCSNQNNMVYIFEKAIMLNEQFKNSVGLVSIDSINALRKLIADFEEQYFNEAKVEVIKMLNKEVDTLLFCVYVRYVISFDNSADEEISWNIARLFIEHPEAFILNNCGMTKVAREIVKKRIKNGLLYWKQESEYDKTRIELRQKEIEKY